MSVEKCPVALNLIQRHKFSPEILEFLRSFKCLYSQTAGFLIWCPQKTFAVHKPTDQPVNQRQQKWLTTPAASFLSNRFTDAPTASSISSSNRDRRTEDISRYQYRSKGFIWSTTSSNHLNDFAQPTTKARPTDSGKCYGYS